MPLRSNAFQPSPMRQAEITRNTLETQITVRLDLDGTGQGKFATGVPFLDHMLDQIARHGLIDLDVQAKGDLHIDAHHTVEDIGITLGQALAKAWGDKKGLTRYGHSYVPLDEALSRVVIDLSGRPGLEYHVDYARAVIGSFDVDLVSEFFHGLVNHAGMTLHIDAHHTVEDIGITFGQALAKAWGDKKGLTRYGHAYVPLDEALSRVVIDLSGRPGLEMHVDFTRAVIGTFDVDLFGEFFHGLVNHAGMTLHIDNLRGKNAHHQAETIFKAFGRALRVAVTPDPRMAGVMPSTKGSL